MNRTILTLALLAASALPALAHVGPGTHGPDGGSLGAGLAHPLTGIDHILAMIAVGLWAAQRGGRALWLWPLAFVTVMLVGGALGMAGVPLPMVEPGILASILVLGLVVAFAARPSDGTGALLIGLFALLHGHAHGTEAAGASWLPYAAGFAFATAGLHLLGIGAGRTAARLVAPWALRALGALTAALGFGLVLAA
jgi:urease accessory protein